jgi:hypothetical protein
MAGITLNKSTSIPTGSAHTNRHTGFDSRYEDPTDCQNDSNAWKNRVLQEAMVEQGMSFVVKCRGISRHYLGVFPSFEYTINE